MTIARSTAKPTADLVGLPTTSGLSYAFGESIQPPAAITEFGRAGLGMFQDASMLQPVTAAGQTVASGLGNDLHSSYLH